MIIQLISLYKPNVFRKYSLKYNIFRDLYELDLLGLEIRNLKYELKENVIAIIFSNNEICYVKEDVANGGSSLLILGTFGKLSKIAKLITSNGNEDLGYKINFVIHNYKLYENNIKIFDSSHQKIMGILNITPDSFYDGGKYFAIKDAEKRIEQLIEQEVDIIDVGGESSRPGSEPVSAKVEKERVLPIIELIKKMKKDQIISIDTTKAEVAEKALEKGASIVNDISGLSSENEMMKIIKKYDASYILMHIKGNPSNMQDNPHYEDVVSELYDYFNEKINRIKSTGVKKIIIDPGIGFGKRIEDNYEILDRLGEFKGFGLPIMIGVSNKSFIGKSLNKKVEEREVPTIIAETLAMKNGAKIIRTHNCAYTKDAINYLKYLSGNDNSNV